MLWGKYTLYFIHSCLHEVELSCNLIFNYSCSLQVQKVHNILDVTVSPLTELTGEIDTLPIRMCILMQWHLSQYGDILKWHRSDDHTCTAAAAARHLQASRQMMPFISRTLIVRATVMIFSVWEWFNGTLPTNIFSRLLVNEGMWHESSREHLQEREVDAIMGTCTQQLNIYNIHHTIFNLDH